MNLKKYQHLSISYRAYCSDPDGNILEDFFLDLNDELKSTMNCSMF